MNKKEKLIKYNINCWECENDIYFKEIGNYINDLCDHCYFNYLLEFCHKNTKFENFINDKKRNRNE